MKKSLIRNYIQLLVILFAVLLLLREVIKFYQTPSRDLLYKVRTTLERLDRENPVRKVRRPEDDHDPRVMDIVLVSCNSKNRMEEVEAFMKSAVLSQTIFDPSKAINFIMFTDSLEEEVKRLVEEWKKIPGLVKISVEIRYTFYQVLIYYEKYLDISKQISSTS